MADKGRDLKVSILSDADRFDLTAPARDLDELGGNAQDAGRDLDDLASTAGTTAGDLNRIAREANDAGRDLADLGRDAKNGGDDLERAARDGSDELDKLGTSAKETAGRVDNAFRDIAQASKAGSRQVEAAGEDGKESLREMGEEGQGTAREMAASFDGTADGIKDAMQEAATNVLAALGPLGAAVGVGAGLAIGWIRGEAERAKEAVGELVGELIDAGGRLGNQSVLTQLRKFAEEGTISDLAAEARAGKVDVADYLRAMAGDPDALARMRVQLDAARTAAEKHTDQLRAAGMVTEDTAQANLDQIIALTNMSTNLDKTADSYALANEAAQAYQEGAGAAAEATQAVADTLDGFVDPAGAYTDTLSALEEAERERAQTVADKTKDATDSWEDHVKDVDVSTDQYLDALERQVKAQEGWADNMATLAKRGVDDGVLEELARMGPEGAPLVAKLTTASDAELTRMNSLFARKGASATDKVAAGIVDGKAKVGSAAGVLMSTAQGVLDAGVTLSTTLVPPSGANVRQMRRDVQNGLAPVVLPVMLQNVPTGTWSRYRP